MTYDEVIDLVRNNEADQWVYNDAKGSHLLRSDVNLRIIKRDTDDEPMRHFHEEWANKHPDPNAHRVYYDIYYGSSFIDDFMLVSVDGFRAELPVPDPQSTVIPRDKYLIARAVDDQGTLDEYIARSGLTVGE
ncbi:MAG: hypothetical protein ACE37H_17350 [Phycisphaeraceae bacterium]